MYLDQECPPSLLHQLFLHRTLSDFDTALGVDIHKGQTERIQNQLQLLCRILVFSQRCRITDFLPDIATQWSTSKVHCFHEAASCRGKWLSLYPRDYIWCVIRMGDWRCNDDGEVNDKHNH